jgi:hypothetical protein
MASASHAAFTLPARCGTAALPFRRPFIAGDLRHRAIGKNRGVISVDIKSRNDVIVFLS